MSEDWLKGNVFKEALDDHHATLLGPLWDGSDFGYQYEEYEYEEFKPSASEISMIIPTRATTWWNGVAVFHRSKPIRPRRPSQNRKSLSQKVALSDPTQTFQSARLKSRNTAVTGRRIGGTLKPNINPKIMKTSATSPSHTQFSNSERPHAPDNMKATPAEAVQARSSRRKIHNHSLDLPQAAHT
jgi:hypothetical protein